MTVKFLVNDKVESALSRIPKLSTKYAVDVPHRESKHLESLDWTKTANFLSQNRL